MRGAFKIGPYNASDKRRDRPPSPEKVAKKARDKKVEEIRAKNPGQEVIGTAGIQHGIKSEGRKIKRSITMAMDLLEQTKVSPLEYLLDIMNREVSPRMEGEPIALYVERVMHARTLKFEAAKAAAVYMHPKIGPIDPMEFRNEKNLAQEIASDLRRMLVASADELPTPRK
jgi:hypothetical protein